MKDAGPLDQRQSRKKTARTGVLKIRQRFNIDTLVLRLLDFRPGAGVTTNNPEPAAVSAQAFQIGFLLGDAERQEVAQSRPFKGMTRDSAARSRMAPKRRPPVERYAVLAVSGLM